MAFGATGIFLPSIRSASGHVRDAAAETGQFVAVESASLEWLSMRAVTLEELKKLRDTSASSWTAAFQMAHQMAKQRHAEE